MRRRTASSSLLKLKAIFTSWAIAKLLRSSMSLSPASVDRGVEVAGLDVGPEGDDVVACELDEALGLAARGAGEP